MRIDGVPDDLKRGRNLVGADGTIHAVRLKRHIEGEKNIGEWKWRDDPFSDTRELNGLKVMMALINNWDLKDANNKIYGGKGNKEQLYMVSDLGASFGTSNLSIPFSQSKGNLTSYEHSKFIRKIAPGYVDFRTPGPPSLIYAFSPRPYLRRVGLDNLLHHIPRDDARWIGHLLAGLSADQIRDAFRAAGYTTEQIDGFTNVIRERISELNNL